MRRALPAVWSSKVTVALRCVNIVAAIDTLKEESGFVRRLAEALFHFAPAFTLRGSGGATLVAHPEGTSGAATPPMTMATTAFRRLF